MPSQKVRHSLRRITLLVLALALVFAAAAGNTPANTAMAASSAKVETAFGYPYASYTYEAVNLRAKPSVNAEKVLVIPEGARITVLKNTGTWVVVEYNNAVGYVSNKYVAIKIPGGTVWKDADATDTKLVQQRLKDLGYYQGSVDGAFGDQTAAAIRSFQSAAGLKADGVAGENTIRLLFNQIAPAATAQNISAATRYGASADASVCGTNLTWSVSYDKKTLTVSGTGNMYEYPEHMAAGGDLSQPWMAYKKTVTRIVLEEGVTSIGSGAFWGFDALTDISFPKSLKTIGFAAFAECYALPAINIQSGVIGESAFIRCTGLKKVTIGTGVTGIGISAFESCDNLDAVYIDDLTAWCHIYFGGNKASPMEYASNLYLKGTLIKDLVIPSTVDRISDYAFEHCNAISTLTVSEGVKAIGEYAFNACSNLTHVTFPSTLESIDAFAFASCGRAYMELPKSLKSIGERAFDGCPMEQTITVYQGRISEKAFRACGASIYLEIGAGVTWIGENAFQDMGALRGVHYAGSEANWNKLSANAGITAHLTNPHWEGNTYGTARVTIEKGPTELSFGGYDWVLLTTNDDQSLLITKEIIDFQKFWNLSTFDQEGLKSGWTDSPLRKWLNNDFLNTFSAADQQAIRTTIVTTPSNAKFGTVDDCNTSDKVFLLSAEEANSYFWMDDARAAELSEAALEKYGSDAGRRDPTTGNTYWWLRTPGMYKYATAYVNYTGSVRYDGIESTQPTICGVRPAMWVANSALDLPEPEPEEEPRDAESFVRRLYRICLNREADDAGLASWVNQLTSGSNTGSQVAYGFIFSPEFKNRNYCNEHYATYLYRAFLGREPDQPGLKYWASLMDNGKTREEIFNGFIGSTEFTNLCTEYGIIRGEGIDVPEPGHGTAPIGFCSECNAESGIHKFVTRLYDVCLNRQPDDAGMLDWSTRLRDHVITGSNAAYGFIFSPEFVNKNYSDDVFVEYLYNAFMGRASDEGGKANWLAQLQGAGWTREMVFEGFASSVEFGMICAQYGIARD